MNYLRRELFIFGYFMRLLGRNFKKYFTVAGMTYSLGALGFHPSSKPTYFFCRYIDDLADGDQKLPAGLSFQALIQRLIAFIAQPEQSGQMTIELVLADALRKLEKRGNSKVIRAELVDFLNSMQLDYERRINQTTLSQKAIDALYHESFAAVLHLALIGFDISLEQKYVKSLGLVQGKLYAIQDAHEDLAQGIINIPEEVIASSQLSLGEIVERPELLTGSEAYLQWRHRELSIARTLVDELLGLHSNKKAKRFIKILVEPLAAYVSKNLSVKNASLKLASGTSS